MLVEVERASLNGRLTSQQACQPKVGSKGEKEMQIKYRIVVRDSKVIEEQYFEGICCSDMKKALLNQETPLANTEAVSQWLYCPFCKQEIEY